jgi:hypothetical protein
MPDERMQLEVGLKRAIEWIGRRRQEDPDARLGLLIDEACRKYDLSPVQADFLYRHFLRPASPANPDS